MTNEMIEYNKSQIAVRTERDLPQHIKFEQYQDIYYKLEGNDQLLCSLLFETGGRINDVVSLRWSDIDFNKKVISMFVDKRDFNLTIPISDTLMNDLKNVFVWTKPDRNDFVFPSKPVKGYKSKSGHLTRVGAWKKMQKWGEMIGIKLHPHMFRHGLAIYLLSQGVNIKVIAARLGHANVFTTMNYYLVITPEIQRECLEGIPMR